MLLDVFEQFDGLTPVAIVHLQNDHLVFDGLTVGDEANA